MRVSTPVVLKKKVMSTDSNRYCKQDEDNDPSPEFEEYLSCAVCGDNGE